MLFILAGGLFLYAIAHKPELGLLAIVTVTSGLVDADRLPLVRLGPVSLQVTDIILLFLLALIVLKSVLTPGFTWIRTPLDFPMLWFYCAVVLASVGSFMQPPFGPNWVLRWLRTLTYFLAYFAVTNLIRDKRQVIFLMRGLFLLAVLATLAALAQLLLPSLSLLKSRSLELVTAGQAFVGVERTYSEADRLTYMMLLISVCSIALGSRWLSPAWELARTGVLGLGLFLTFQRNYWLTMFCMMAILVTQVSWAQRSRILRGIALAVIVVLLMSTFAGRVVENYFAAAADRLIRGMQPETLAGDTSMQWRVLETDYAMHSIAEHPLTGVGLANFYRPATERDAFGYGLRWYVHNVYLWVWVDMGVFGLIPFLWLLVQVLIRGFTRWRSIDDLRLQAVALGITLGILGQAISNFIAPNFLQSWGLVIFPILFGVNEVMFRQTHTAGATVSAPR